MSMSPVLNSYLSNQKISYDVLEHAHTSSALSTALVVHVAPEKMAKAVMVKHGEHYTMCVLPSSHRLIMEWLEYERQLPYQLAREKELKQLLPDCELGAIPCVGQAFDIEVVLDSALMEKKDIYVESGDHLHLLHMNGNNFRQLMGDVWQAVISCPIRDEFEDILH